MKHISFSRDFKSNRRQIHKIYASVFAILISASVANAQQNDTCAMLEKELQTINRDALSLLKKYPLTNIGLGICMKTAEEELKKSEDETKALKVFGVCAGVVCFFSSLTSCYDVAMSWVDFLIRKDSIEKRMRELNCPK